MADRRKNFKDAFQAESKAVSNKRILIIDEVTTNGSTLNAYAKALKDAGANAVFGLTITRAILKN